MKKMLTVFVITFVLAGCPVKAPSNYQSKQIRVAIVDTGIKLNDKEALDKQCDPSLNADLSQSTLDDVVGHGTRVTHLIIDNAKNSNYCLVFIKYYKDDDLSHNGYRVIASFRYASEIKADIVNFSSGGSSYLAEEYIAIQQSKAMFIVAAGNQGVNLDTSSEKFYPAMYKLNNIQVVGALDVNLHTRLSSSNYGSIVKFWELGNYIFGSGTSYAAATHTGKLIHALSH